MGHRLGFTPEEAERQEMEHTLAEIGRQPAAWQTIYAGIRHRKAEIACFLSRLDKDTRVILTGAGSSGFIGDALAPLLRQELGFAAVESVHTTSLVANPDLYFPPAVKTLLISLGRSGDSPESLAAMELAEQRVREIYHLIITCNPQGKLAGFHNERTLRFTLESVNDAAFAMTGSVTGMMLAAYGILHNERDWTPEVARLADYAAAVIDRVFIRLVGVLADADRAVVLGSGPLWGAAREGALKILELTAGKVLSRYDTPLGFRHGPKAMLTSATAVLYFAAAGDYTRQYDLDMLRELARAEKRRLVVVDDRYDPEMDRLADLYVYNSVNEKLPDGFTLYIPVLVAQIAALFASLQCGCTPDNPFPGGEVNKVVQGVKIHPWRQQ
ncbi:sugar isomerase (sis) [Lucifera butyrica]|uniref:Sugar isomerase (Sis) n=1 Tax=Lucifera butyrica TaxID=1351585 RepID=A0A498RH20_9FIRM|nr:SIS domain-containing protein [Lucifera butyrica]VBB09382.1 sugar isomerase (sis) [Lucifera butyrica]